jgi:hypothetical protein
VCDVVSQQWRATLPPLWFRAAETGEDGLYEQAVMSNEHGMCVLGN